MGNIEIKNKIKMSLISLTIWPMELKTIIKLYHRMYVIINY